MHGMLLHVDCMLTIAEDACGIGVYMLNNMELLLYFVAHSVVAFSP